MMENIRIGLTQGDPNGIGPEVIIKAFADERMLELCTPVLFGSSGVIRLYKDLLGDSEFKYKAIKNASDAKAGVFNLVETPGTNPVPCPGEATPESGMAALSSIAAATEAVRKGDVDVVVTAPINKHFIQNDEFQFPGHTEYFENEFGEKGESLMILADDSLRVALVTTHLPISEVSKAITADAIMNKARILYRSLCRDYAKTCPRIAVLGLNPHCGDNGLLGNEEVEVIAPAIAELRKEGVMAFGPFAADGFFGSDNVGKYDAVLAMYHDQGLAPFKTKAMSNGVNYTAGLSIVRTSPDHGTGADIAGKGIASEQSMREAVYHAIDIYRNRKIYDAAHARPLKKQYVDRSGDKTVLDLSKDEPSEL